MSRKFVVGVKDGWFKGSPLQVFDANGVAVNLLAKYGGYAFKDNRSNNDIVYYSSRNDAAQALKISGDKAELYEVEVIDNKIVKWLESSIDEKKYTITFTQEQYDRMVAIVAKKHSPSILPCPKCGYPKIGGIACDNCGQNIKE